MSLWSHADSTRRRLRGITVGMVVTAGVLLGVLGIAPLRSQLLGLEAGRASSPVPLDDPWADVWDGAPSQDVPLSAQNVAPPFGGGTVDGVLVRALYDDEQVYLALEWDDGAAEVTVNGFDAFADAAAVQFPAVPGSIPPYTMGATDQPVNIWQWRAVWQNDIEEGFATSRTRYPDTYVDYYPNADDLVFITGEHVGNPLSQRTHESPVENLIAEGFGTLTHSSVQDVAGWGEWRDGRWRVVFARQLGSAAAGLAEFAIGESTQVAFAVWDGGSGNRNGLKSIAQFIELDIGPDADAVPDDTVAAAPGAFDEDAEIPWVAIAVIFVALLPLLAMGLVAARGGGTS